MPFRMINGVLHDDNSTALGVITSVDELYSIEDHLRTRFQLTVNAHAAIVHMTSLAYQSQIGNPVEKDSTSYWLNFVKYVAKPLRIPMGYAAMLYQLNTYKLVFIVDDRLLMKEKTTMRVRDAMPSMQVKLIQQLNISPDALMTRFQCAENTLHEIVWLLNYVQTQDLYVYTLNGQTPLILKRESKSPEAFLKYAQENLRRFFNEHPPQFTSGPLLRYLDQAFNMADGGRQQVLVNVLLFDDRCGESPECLLNKIQQRPYPAQTPIVFRQIAMNSRQTALYRQFNDDPRLCVMNCDDYGTEKAKVLQLQGSALPFTQGMYQILSLIGGIRICGVDLIHQPQSLSLEQLSFLMGYRISGVMYQYYMNCNPYMQRYSSEEDDTDDDHAGAAYEQMETPVFMAEEPSIIDSHLSAAVPSIANNENTLFAPISNISALPRVLQPNPRRSTPTMKY